MTVFILAPVLKVLEDGVQLVVGVRLQVAVDGDVAPVTDLLRQVRRVEDELGLEERVLAVLREETQIEREVEVGHGLVQETRVARLVARHEGEDLGAHRRRLLEAAAELLVQQEAGELRGAGALEELDEDAAGLAGDAVRGGLERVVAHEVLLVEILLELLEDRHELGFVEVGVDLLAEELLHLVEVGGVEAGRQEVLVRSLLDAVARHLQAGLVVHRRARDGGRARRARDADGRRLQGGGLARARAELGDAGSHEGGGHDGGHGCWELRRRTVGGACVCGAGGARARGDT